MIPEPGVRMQQILDSRGQLVDALPDLDDTELVDVYTKLLSTRMVDEKLLNLQRQGRMPAYYQCSGQEAHVGAALALRDDDWIFTAYRELGLWIARGLGLKAATGFWLGIPDDDDVWDVTGFNVTRLNATIGTHLPHAVGFGYAERLKGGDTVSMVVFGDGATSESDFHAAMNFAGVWKTPTIFLCQNNQVAQSTTVDKQTAAETLAQKADAYGFPGIRVDGMDPFAMYVATLEARQRAERGEGPTFIEMVTWRYAPHSTYDGTPVYRTEAEEAHWRTLDPITRTRTFLEHKGLWAAEQEEQMRQEISEEIEAALAELESRPTVSRDYSPRHLFDRVPQLLLDQLHREQDDMGEPRTELDPSEIWRVGPDPEPSGPRERMDLTEALNRALTDGFDADPTLVVMGEDVALEGGVFRVTEGMLDRFGPGRVIDTPLCETGIVGTSVGMAMAGLRPVAEMEFAGFVYPAFDQVIGHVGRIRWRYRGHLTSPVVVRLPVGTGIDAYEFHTDSPETYFAHAPGLTVVFPATPYDAKGLLASALKSPDPVMFFEPIALYRGLYDQVPTEHYEIPIGRAAIRRPGTDVTIVTWGPPIHEAGKAAGALADEGISAEVIDLRTIYPWDRDAVLASVEKTGRLVVAHETHLTGGFGAEIVATIAEEAAYSLETPPVRVGHMDVFWGPTRLEQYSVISADRIAAGARRAIRG